MSWVSGKVIISGEHSVVYGKPALVSSIDKGVRVEVVEGNGTVYLSDKKNLIKKAIEVAGGGNEISVEIKSELPIGAGLGSSAAVSAAVIKAVREYLGKPIGSDELFELTMKCEQIAHNGRASGVDPAAVVYGGMIVYVKGQPIERFVAREPVKLLLVNSGKPSETTGELIEMVEGRRGEDAIIAEMAKVTGEIKKRLIEGEGIKEQIDENGKLLEELGVVGEKGEKIAKVLRKAGYGVKVSGAGGVRTGSGMMIVAGEDFAQAKKMLDNMQIEYFGTVIGEK